jgi:hypothetical protein
MWDADMPGALVADEMGLGNTFASVAAAMLCNSVTKRVVLGLPLSILCGNTVAEWVTLADNDIPGSVGEYWEWYLLQRLNSVACLLLAIHISKMYFSHWKPPGVSERMWNVNLEASISGEYQTLGAHSWRSSE